MCIRDRIGDVLLPVRQRPDPRVGVDPHLHGARLSVSGACCLECGGEELRNARGEVVVEPAAAAGREGQREDQDRSRWRRCMLHGSTFPGALRSCKLCTPKPWPVSYTHLTLPTSDLV